MSQHSAGPDREEGPIWAIPRYGVGPSNAILGQMRDASCGRLTARAQHRGDLTPAIEPAQSDLPADHEAEEQDERGVLGGQAPCVFTRRRNSSFRRSITLVVLSVFHWRFGNWKKVSSSSPPSWRLRTTPGQRGVHFRSKAV